MEYVYLLETRESIRLGEQVYKLGKSKQKIFKRFGDYPVGSILITYRMCLNCDVLEKEILKLFNKKYENIPLYGTEYFKGDFIEMCNDINEFANKEYKNNVVNTQDKNIIGNLSFKNKSLNKQIFNNFNEYINQLGGKNNKMNSSDKITPISKIKKNININTSNKKKINLEITQYICKNCSKIYTSRVGLWKHNKICVPKKEEKIYDCSFCNKSFSCRQSKWVHQKTCNKKEKDLNQEKQNELFNTINELKTKIKNYESKNNEIEV